MDSSQKACNQAGQAKGQTQVSFVFPTSIYITKVSVFRKCSDVYRTVCINSNLKAQIQIWCFVANNNRMNFEPRIPFYVCFSVQVAFNDLYQCFQSYSGHRPAFFQISCNGTFVISSSFIYEVLKVCQKTKDDVCLSILIQEKGNQMMDKASNAAQSAKENMQQVQNLYSNVASIDLLTR